MLYGSKPIKVVSGTLMENFSLSMVDQCGQ